MHINSKEIELLKKRKAKHFQKCKKNFNNKKYNHLNNSRIQKFFDEHIDIPMSEKLIEIPFKNKFTPYLYMFLKVKALKSEFEWSSSFFLSVPLEVNLSELSRLSGAGRNTIKRALNELEELNLLITFSPNSMGSINQFRRITILNDELILEYDSTQGRLIFKGREEIC